MAFQVTAALSAGLEEFIAEVDAAHATHQFKRTPGAVLKVEGSRGRDSGLGGFLAGEHITDRGAPSGAGGREGVVGDSAGVTGESLLLGSIFSDEAPRISGIPLDARTDLDLPASGDHAVARGGVAVAEQRLLAVGHDVLQAGVPANRADASLVAHAGADPERYLGDGAFRQRLERSKGQATGDLLSPSAPSAEKAWVLSRVPL